MSEKPAPGRFEEEMSELVCCAIEAGHDGSDENIERLHVAEQTLCAAHAAEVEQAMNRAEYRIGVLLSDKRDLENKLAEARAAGVAEGYRSGFHAAAKEMFCRECTGGMQTLTNARAEGRLAMAREALVYLKDFWAAQLCGSVNTLNPVYEWLESQAREGEK